MKRWVTILASFLLLLLAVGCTQGHAIDITLISDIHYDPLYGTAEGYRSYLSGTTDANPLGTEGCDAPLSLIESMAKDISDLSNAFTIFGGDWQRHNFSETMLNTTAVFDPLSAVFASIQTSGLPASSEVNMAVTIGNNDLEKNFYFNYSAPVQTYLQEQIAAMKSHKILSDTEAQQMGSCAFYVKEVEGFRVITLNTILWSQSLTPAIPDNVEDPCGQFAYLDSALESAASAGVKVIVLGHIPPVANAYNILTDEKFSTVEKNMYWKKRFQDRYNALLKQYKSTISTHIYGHTHVFTVLAFESSGVPGFVMPSISPVQRTIPSYLVSSFSPKMELEGLYQRYLNDNGEWVRGQNVVGLLGLRYGFQNFTDLRENLLSLGSDENKFVDFLHLHAGGGTKLYPEFPEKACDSFCRSLIICGMVHDDYDALKKCTDSIVVGPQFPVSTTQSVVTALLIIFVSLFATTAMVLKVMYPKWRAGNTQLIPDIDWGQQLIGRSFKKKKKQGTAGSATELDAAVPAEEVMGGDERLELQMPEPEVWSEEEDERNHRRV